MAWTQDMGSPEEGIKTQLLGYLGWAVQGNTPDMLTDKDMTLLQ